MNLHDLDDEFAVHLEHKTRELEAAGWAPDAAAREARRQFGDPRRFKQACVSAHRHDRGLGAVLARAGADWSVAIRNLRRRWRSSFAMGAVLTLGVCIAAVVATATYDAVLAPLPYPTPRQLVAVWSTHSATGDMRGHVSPADLVDLGRGLALDAPVPAFGYMSWPVTLVSAAGAERIEGTLVTPGFNTTLGVAPMLGSDLASLDRTVVSSSVLISARLARRLSIDTLQSPVALNLNGGPVQVAGVMPPGFSFPTPDTDVWVPYVPGASDFANRASRWLKVVARRPTGESAQTFDVRVAAVGTRLAAEYPASNQDWGLTTMPLQDALIGPTRTVEWALFGALAVLALITVANAVSLQLGHLHSRASVLRLQVALGADAWRLNRQLACEAVVLGLIGVGAGGALAAGVLKMLAALAPADLHRLSGVAAGPVTWVTAGTISVLACLAVVAASLTSRWDAGSFDTTRSIGPSRGERQRHYVAVAAQTACVTVLLVVAGTFAYGAIRLQRVDLGLDTSGWTVARMQWPRNRYTTPAAQAQLIDGALSSIRQAPGVAAAEVISDLPLGGNSPALPVRVEGAGATATEAALATRWVSPGYLDGVHIARTEGRSFALADDGRAPGVAIVNTDLARKYWPGQSAVGRRIQVGADHEWRTVVGVVNDVRHLGPGEPEGPAVYLPYAQRAEPWLTWTWLLARPAQPGADIGAAMRAAVQSVDRELPLSRLGSFAALAARTTAVPRLMAGASMTVAGLTLVLAASGLLALLGLVTRGERHNLVIRSALGAPRRGVLGQPVRLAFGLVGAGWLAGALVALPLRGWLGTMDGAFADGPWWVIAVSALVLLVTAAMAVIGPVRSLARLRPADVLRAR